MKRRLFSWESCLLRFFIFLSFASFYCHTYLVNQNLKLNVETCRWVRKDPMSAAKIKPFAKNADGSICRGKLGLASMLEFPSN